MSGSLHSVVLLNGACGATDFEFLLPMLARNRSVQVGTVLDSEISAREWPAGRTCVVGYAGGASLALQASHRPNVELLVLVSPTLGVELQHDVTVPTLVIIGQGVGQGEGGAARSLVGAIADARLATIDAGDALLFERPAEVLSLIEQFLDAPSRYAAGTELQSDRP